MLSFLINREKILLKQVFLLFFCNDELMGLPNIDMVEFIKAI